MQKAAVVAGLVCVGLPLALATRSGDVIASNAAIAVGIARLELGASPVPFVHRETAVVVDIQACKQIRRRLLSASELDSRQHAVAVGVERVEVGTRAVPFASRDAAVVIEIEVLERVVAVVIDVCGFAQELGPRQYAVAVVIGAIECRAIEVPFVARYTSIAIVIELLEPLRSPITERVFAFEPFKWFLSFTSRAACPHAYLFEGQHAVTVPVVHHERLVASAPFAALNDSVPIRIHLDKAHSDFRVRRLSWLSTRHIQYERRYEHRHDCDD